MKTRSEQTEFLKDLIADLENKNDRIALLWTLTNSKKINRRQFKELFEAINYTHSCTKLKCEKCESDWVEIRATCFNCQHETGDLST